MTRPVAPRHAASLVLVRRGPEGTEILLGRRASKHRFLPNVFAFPGGKLDLSDRSINHFNKLENIDNFPDNLLRSLAVTAVRETWEETGILIGRRRDDRLQADLSGLHYFCRAITPPDMPIRFHARFFLRDITGMQVDLAGSGELLDLGFRPVDRALELPLADITEFVVRLVGNLGPDLRPDRVAFWRYRKGKPMIRWENS